MGIQLDPIISEFETQEQADGHGRWQAFSHKMRAQR